jgi:hypothetical protein
MIAPVTIGADEITEGRAALKVVRKGLEPSRDAHTSILGWSPRPNPYSAENYVDH